jgi:hypothetical protein
MNYNPRMNALASRVGSTCFFALLALSACKTTSSKDANLASTSQAMSESMNKALPLKDYDVATLKSHLKNVVTDELKDKQLWALMLKEPDSDAACAGMAVEVYYFADKGDNNTDGYPVVTAKPMPMNGPCGFLVSTELKKFRDIGSNLMESTPMGEIGTFDNIRVSIKQAITISQQRYKTFKYSQGVKVYRHLHPDMWSYPWYAIYGEACGASATVIMNASTGAMVPNMEAPPPECP